MQEVTEKMNFTKQKIKTIQDREKSYVDVRRKELEFKVRNSVYLKMSSEKGTITFSLSRKLNPRYIGPFDIIAKVEDMAYELALPPNLDKVHNVLPISKLMKYIRDENHIISDYRELNIQSDVTYMEEPVRIFNN